MAKGNNEMNGKKVLVTGGTGTVGAALIERLLTDNPGIDRMVALSNNEQEQYEMAARFPASKHPVSYIMADVRDRERMMMALKGIDIVVHAAAMKHVPVSEANPIECSNTNILGSQNVIDAALANGVQKVVALSTDKAVEPVNVYGASKMILERLFLNADTVGDTRFSVVRFANVFGSKGSVVPFFQMHKSKGFLPITHPGMTRFSITMDEALDLIMLAISDAWGGEILVPIAPSYRILDIAMAIAPDLEHRTVGMRPGEKLHEVMISADESVHAVINRKHHVICPYNGRWDKIEYCRQTSTNYFENLHEYHSGTNTEWLSVEEITSLIKNQALEFN